MDKKNSGDDDFLNFVNLVEEHKIILSKSQIRAIKTQKREAIEKMIVKWAEMSGQQLTEQTLMKKLHNMKTRANAAAEKNNLSVWQSKLRELIGIDATDNVTPSKSNDDEVCTSTDASCASEKIIPKKRKAGDVLNCLETDDTRDLSNDELQRYLLLKQVKLVNLQIEKIEKPTVDVQFVEWTEEESNDVVDDINL